jgi:alkanesulfonate monooxygenase SsuD/methylene tetrahydromethanopterin reductase-like flavin-dependent oxidoreductase (luciferase family)
LLAPVYTGGPGGRQVEQHALRRHPLLIEEGRRRSGTSSTVHRLGSPWPLMLTHDALIVAEFVDTSPARGSARCAPLAQERRKTMTRDGPTPQFGINLHTWMHPGLDPVTEARHAEQLGFDLVTLHRDVLHGTDPSFENWTLLTWLAARTTRIRVAPMVLALPHRHPSVLAKMAETLDRLSDGRLVLVLGGGGAMNDPTYRALGLAQRSPREKVEALEEAIDLMRGLWSSPGLTYAGKHFQTEGATLEPQPDHPIPIWLGVFGDRMLDLVGRKADGWFPSLPFLPPEQAYRKLETIRSVAAHAGRNPDEITYGYNIPVLVEAGTVSARGQIVGSAEEVASQLADIAGHGFTVLNLWPGGEAATQRERLAGEVLPRVYDLLA